MIDREQALELIKKYNKKQANLNHYLESEAIMKAVAKKLGEDENYWAMLGLMHDIDWEMTESDSKQHLTKAPELLKQAGFDDKFIQIVISHGFGFDCAGLKDKKRSEKIERALAASETLTGLIYAYAIMRNKKISDMELSGLKKKFKDKAFAAGCNREIIKECENFMPLDEFLQTGIDALKTIKNDIGLE